LLSAPRHICFWKIRLCFSSTFKTPPLGPTIPKLLCQKQPDSSQPLALRNFFTGDIWDQPGIYTTPERAQGMDPVSPISWVLLDCGQWMIQSHFRWKYKENSVIHQFSGIYREAPSEQCGDDLFCCGAPPSCPGGSQEEKRCLAHSHTLSGTLSR